MAETGRNRAGKLVLVLAATCGLAACDSGEPNLIQLRSETRSPDEFAILPNKPLEIPREQASLAALPAPTPGGTNRTDPTPVADAAIALGGNPAAAARTSAASDGALLTQTTRHGVDPTIRQNLAVADAQFRQENRALLLERLTHTSTYFRAYEPYALNQQAELARWRARGVKTVTAPPPPSE